MPSAVFCALAALSLVAAVTAGSVAGPVESGVVPGAAYLGVTYDCHYSDQRTEQGRKWEFALKSLKKECNKKLEEGLMDRDQHDQCVRELEQKYALTKEQKFEPLRSIHAHTLSSGEQVAFNFIRHPEGSSRFVVHFHGNGQDVGKRILGLMSKLAMVFKAHVIAVDFPGYGQSSGEATKDNIDAAMAEFLTWVSATIGGPQNMVVTAWSIGTGISSTALMNSGLSPSGVVLMAPYSAAQDVVGHVVGKQAGSKLGAVAGALQSSSWWNTVRAVASFSSPLFVSHGIADETCPFSMGEKVCNAAGNRCTFVANPSGGSGHNIDNNTADCPQLAAWADTITAATSSVENEEVFRSLLGGECRDVRPIISGSDAIAATSVGKLAKLSSSSS